MSRIGGHIMNFGKDYAQLALSDDNERIQTLYFNWLCVLVHVDDYMGKSWYILAKILHDIEFYWTISNDDNRAADGVKLREIWLSNFKNEAEDLGVDVYVQADALSGACTIFEMMVGLATRIESDIMQRDGEGNRTWMWFWNMVHNLISDADLINCHWWHNGCNDEEITPKEANIIKEMVRRCLDREYEPDGTGGCLFPIFRSGIDRREVELWYQAQDWISDNFGDEIYDFDRR